MRVLVVSNLDSKKPFGQFTRPFFLGRAMADAGAEVANVGVDCARVDFGPAWSVGVQSGRRLARAAMIARQRFRPHVVYAHQNLPAAASLLVADGTPVAADFHSLPSVEWAGLAAAAGGTEALRLRGAALKAGAAERFVARRADLVIAAASALGEEIAARYRPRRPPAVVVNGVDHELLEAPPAPEAPFADEGFAAHAVAIMPASSSGSNRYALEFLGDVAHALERDGQRVLIHVLGSSEGPEATLLRYHGLQAVGPWIEHADVCLLPYPAEAMHYGGAKNKLLEYLARGRRVVSTAEGVRGLEEVAGWDGVTVVADAADAFAAAVAAATRPGAPRLDEERTAMRERLRWDVLGREALDALRAVAA